jgi:hypothetical protein
MNGSMPHPGEWKATIFAADNLPPGQYTLVISNDGWSTLDIDSVSSLCSAVRTRQYFSDHLVLQYRRAQRHQLVTAEHNC